MDHQTGQLSSVDGTNLFVQAWSENDRPQGILLLVHGLGEHSGRYQNYVNYFVPRGYALYAFDTRGHGRSGGRRVYVDRFQQYVDDIRLIVADIRSNHDSPKPFILGHSLGSLMVLSYGLQSPDEVAGVIVTGTALRDALELPPWKRSLAGVFSRVAPAIQMNNGVSPSYLSHDPDVVAAYKRDPLIQLTGTPRLLTETEATRAYLFREAQAWRTPLLILHGGADRVCLPGGAQAFYEQVPPGLAQLIIYEGLYHEIHNEPARSEVFSDIERWLRAQQLLQAQAHTGVLQPVG